MVDSVTSARPFVLDDGTALCAIMTVQATIERCKPEVIKESGTRRHRVWRICAGDPLYALGHIERLAAGELDGDSAAGGSGRPKAQTSYDRARRVNEITGELLRSWKTNPKALIARFDADGSGHVDWHEWERAQAQARAIAEKRVAEAKAPAPKTPEVKDSKKDSASIEFELERPDGDRPLLVANCTEREMTRRAHGRSLLGLILFVGGALYVLSTIGSCIQR